MGHVVAERLKDLARVVIDEGTSWQMLEAIKDEELLILVDAAEANEQLPAGHWYRFMFPNDAAAIVEHKVRDTHTMSIDSMLQMGQVLGWLLPNVWIYAIAG